MTRPCAKCGKDTPWNESAPADALCWDCEMKAFDNTMARCDKWIREEAEAENQKKKRKKKIQDRIVS